jgi:hypothetical protein
MKAVAFRPMPMALPRRTRLAQVETSVLDVTVVAREGEDEIPVPGAIVEIFYPDDTSAVETTNAGGVAMFSYNQKRGVARLRATTPGGTQSPIEEVELIGAGEQVTVRFPGEAKGPNWLVAALAVAGLLWVGYSWGTR